MERNTIDRVVAESLLVAMLAATLACVGGERPTAEPAGDAAETGGERIVAEVNGRPIRARQLDAIVEAEGMRVDPSDEADAGIGESELRREALDLAIRAEIVYQAAVERGLTVPGEAIEEQLEVVRSQFASEEDFLAYLHENGTTTDDLRGEARRRLLMEAYAKTVTEGLEGDPRRARELYERQAERFRGREQIRVAQILVRLRPTDGEQRREAAREKIEQAHARALAGEDFAALARAYSESPLAERGGDMGFIPRGRMIPEFEDVVFATPVGQITPVFETPHGFNVVKVLERRDARRTSFEDVKTGLMLVLAREQRDRRIQEHVDELLRGADIRILDPALVSPSPPGSPAPPSP